VITVEGGRVRTFDMPPVDELAATVRVSRTRVDLEQVSFRLGGGRVEIAGGAGFRDERFRDLDVKVTAFNALLVREEGLRIRSDLDLRLVGPELEDLTLRGAVGIRGLRYFEDVSYLSTQPSLAPLPTTDDPAVGNVKLDVTVTARSETIKIRNNVLDADFEGKAQVGGTIAVPRPDGRFRMNRGELILPTATLKLERAVVGFRESEPLRPYLSARATAVISGTRVYADVSGPPDRLDIEARSNPPLPEPEVIALMTTGLTRQGFDAEAVGGVAATVLYRQVSRQFSGGGDEESFLSDLASRVELEVGTGDTGRGIPSWRATIRLWDRVFLSANQDDPFNYGMDLIYRLSLP